MSRCVQIRQLCVHRCEFILLNCLLNCLDSLEHQLVHATAAFANFDQQTPFSKIPCKQNHPLQTACLPFCATVLLTAFNGMSSCTWNQQIMFCTQSSSHQQNRRYFASCSKRSGSVNQKIIGNNCINISAGKLSLLNSCFKNTNNTFSLAIRRFVHS